MRKNVSLLDGGGEASVREASARLAASWAEHHGGLVVLLDSLPTAFPHLFAEK